MGKDLREEGNQRALETKRTLYSKVLWQKEVHLSTRPKRGPVWLEPQKVSEGNGVRCTLAS